MTARQLTAPPRSLESSSRAREAGSPESATYAPVGCSQHVPCHLSFRTDSACRKSPPAESALRCPPVGERQPKVWTPGPWPRSDVRRDVQADVRCAPVRASDEHSPRMSDRRPLLTPDRSRCDPYLHGFPAAAKVLTDPRTELVAAVQVGLLWARRYGSRTRLSAQSGSSAGSFELPSTSRWQPSRPVRY
jgi:hypothetical protein